MEPNKTCDECPNEIQWFLLSERNPDSSNDYLVANKHGEVWVDHYCSLSEFWHLTRGENHIAYWAEMPKIKL